MPDQLPEPWYTLAVSGCAFGLGLTVGWVLDRLGRW